MAAEEALLNHIPHALHRKMAPGIALGSGIAHIACMTLCSEEAHMGQCGDDALSEMLREGMISLSFSEWLLLHCKLRVGHSINTTAPIGTRQSHCIVREVSEFGFVD